MKSVISIESVWRDYTASQLKKAVFQYYTSHLSGKRVWNESQQVYIHFTNQPGRNKLVYGGHLGIVRANAVRILPTLMKHAVYNNWGNRKSTDNIEVVGYQNYKVAFTLDGKKYHARISIQQKRKDGKLYYTHIINFIKE